jgi:hypothetical protein
MNAIVRQWQKLFRQTKLPGHAHFLEGILPTLSAQDVEKVSAELAAVRELIAENEATLAEYRSKRFADEDEMGAWMTDHPLNWMQRRGEYFSTRAGR